MTPLFSSSPAFLPIITAKRAEEPGAGGQEAAKKRFSHPQAIPWTPWHWPGNRTPRSLSRCGVQVSVCQLEVMPGPGFLVRGMETCPEEALSHAGSEAGDQRPGGSLEPHLGGSHFLLCPFLVCVTFGRLWALSELVSSPVKGEYCCFSLLLCRLGTVT